MHWTDNSIILSAKKHGETSAVVRLFSEQHGVFGGVVRGANSKANRGIIQPGNIVNATWQARLSEQLGTFKCELMQANAAQIMQDSGRLSALSAACSLLESALPERHPYPRLYLIFQAFLELMTGSEPWHSAYVRLEMELLADTGFGLDLTSCAATSTTKDLVYVSPKSGRAVCREAGEPYHEKMLPLPAFLLGAGKNNAVKSTEILDGLQLTGYFLDSWLLAPHNRKLPAARGRLIQNISKAKELDAA